MTKTQLLDLVERAGWTLAQAAVAFGITETSGISAWWALVLAPALSAAKTYVQHQLDGEDKKERSADGPSPRT